MCIWMCLTYVSIYLEDFYDSKCHLVQRFMIFQVMWWLIINQQHNMYVKLTSSILIVVWAEFIHFVLLRRRDSRHFSHHPVILSGKGFVLPNSFQKYSRILTHTYSKLTDQNEILQTLMRNWFEIIIYLDFVVYENLKHYSFQYSCELPRFELLNSDYKE